MDDVLAVGDAVVVAAAGAVRVHVRLSDAEDRVAEARREIGARADRIEVDARSLGFAGVVGVVGAGRPARHEQRDEGDEHSEREAHRRGSIPQAGAVCDAGGAVKRIALAILGVVIAVAIIVVIARESGEEKPTPPERPKPVPALAAQTPEAGIGEPDVIDPEESDMEVKELSFGDGSANQRSIRIETPNTDLQARVRDWLEPRESAAVASRAAIDCHAQLAKTSLVSIVCVTMPAGEPADARVPPDASPSARYESLTLRVVGSEIKELTLQDLLEVDAGKDEVVAACKKVAEPPTPCVCRRPRSRSVPRARSFSVTTRTA